MTILSGFIMIIAHRHRYSTQPPQIYCFICIIITLFNNSSFLHSAHFHNNPPTQSHVNAMPRICDVQRKIILFIKLQFFSISSPQFQRVILGIKKLIPFIAYALVGNIQKPNCFKPLIIFNIDTL